jgi:two-component sensor histidine kinase
MRGAAATGVNTAAAEGVTCYQRTFHGRPDQVRQVRQDITRHLAGSPVTADAILISSELATNAIVHSASNGEFFTIRCERHPGYIWIETEDLGGPWQHQPPGDRPHGLDIISALTGPDNWGTETTGDGDRVVWARLDLPPGQGGDR